ILPQGRRQADRSLILSRPMRYRSRLRQTFISISFRPQLAETKDWNCPRHPGIILILDLEIQNHPSRTSMISQTAEYALRAVVVLGSQPGRPMTSQDVARVARVPGDYLSKVLQALGRAGLVEARRGLRGGYVLTVYDVVQPVDPLRRINSSPLQFHAPTERLCSLHQRLDDAVAMVESYFKQTTIASLLNDQTAPRPGPLCELPGSLGADSRDSALPRT